MADKRIKTMCEIIEHREIAPSVYSLWIKSDEISRLSKPGQFVSLYCRDKSRLLPRPISICEIDAGQGCIRLVYRIFGQGTEEISNYKVGELIHVLGPLGNGFTLEEEKVAIIIAGGIGIPPMLELCKQLKGEKHIFLGYRDQIFLADEFKAYGQVYLATEDGHVGHQGNVLSLLEQQQIKGEQIYACGPKGLLKALQSYALDHQIPTQLSVEEKMACGVGACLGCTCETKDATEKNKRVCKEGPVFLAEEVVL